MSGSMAKDSFVVQLYRKFYIEREHEQIDLYSALNREFDIKRVVYPGSFVQMSPSFVFPDVVYIDSDENAKIFFNDPQLKDFIKQRKEYPQAAQLIYYCRDYRKPVKELINQFDLMISQAAGFIAEPCKPYLKSGGMLLVNNSHGDAGKASIDQDYQSIGVFHKSRSKYTFSNKSLEQYFIPKKRITVTREYLHKIKKGVGYTKTASLYLFRRV
jgi:hypothetical protein